MATTYDLANVQGIHPRKKGKTQVSPNKLKMFQTVNVPYF